MLSVSLFEQLDMLTGYFDGACAPNPGEVGIGSVIYRSDGIEFDWAYDYREYGTNNFAEYNAAILLLERASELGVKSLKCIGDSQLVINQINDRFACYAPELMSLLKRVKDLCNAFEHVEFAWVKRNQNARADELSQLGLNNRRFHCMERKPNYDTDQNAQQRIIVKRLNGNRILINERSVLSVFNLANRTCSCIDFKRNQRCRHAASFQRSKQ